MSRIQFFLQAIDSLIDDNCSHSHPYYSLDMEQHEAVMDILADLLSQDEQLNDTILDAIWRVVDSHLLSTIENVKEEY